jgi:tetratricopeptide (TPR) repeat protein
MEKNSQKGRDIHAKVENLRESGNFWESIKLAQDAVRTYYSEKDYSGLVDIQGSISLAYGHLYQKTKDKIFLIYAQGSAELGVKIAKEAGLNTILARPIFNLAKVEEDLGDYAKAAKFYQEAVEIFKKYPQKEHNRPGVLADMKIHMETCKYKAGDKGALQRSLEAIDELENSDEKEISKYNFDVWLSGGHMRIAQMLKDADPQTAKKTFVSGKRNNQRNPELKLRAEQWKELSSAFGN